MINVYLDDLRPCPRGFTLARNAEECIALLESCEIHILSLDHDLGYDQPTGYDVTRYMVEHGKFAREIYLHTSSAIGRTNMYQLLYRNRPDGVKVYSYPMPDEVLAEASRMARAAE